MTETANAYLMEHADEAYRLDIKTDPEAVRAQALLCGIRPGARVLDVGCGSGKASSVLHEIVGPQGEVVGIDYSEDRLAYARKHFGKDSGIHFLQADLMRPLDHLGAFDFIWVRFVLEYFLREAPSIVANLTHSLKPDGRLCLLDLDYNSMNHYPLPEPMRDTLAAVMERGETAYNFDPYAGRKLYSYLYDLAYRDIRVHMVPHHLFYGQLLSQDAYNWNCKIAMWTSTAPELFSSYPGGVDGFLADFSRLAADPRRFTYTPMIICTGMKPTKGD